MAMISNTLFVPRTEGDYNRLVTLLDDLIDEVGEDEDHLLASLMESISVMIEYYENANLPEPA
jgi:HTH-type transcriptional regulator/antitoxin HigA